MKQYLPLIAVAVISIMGTVILMMVFGRSGKSEKMIRREMQIEFSEKQRVSDSLLFVERLKLKDEEIALLQTKDTVLITRYEATKKSLPAIDANVRNLSRDSLYATAK